MKDPAKEFAVPPSGLPIRNLIPKEVGGTHLALRQRIICCDKQTVVDKASRLSCLLNNLNFLLTEQTAAATSCHV